MVTHEGLYLMIENKGYFAAFSAFPYLALLPSSQIFDVEYCGHGHIRWEEADIDLNTNILANPEKYPVVMHPILNAAAQLGAVGGSVRSKRKAASSRANGAKGGRPRKRKDSVSA